MSALHFNSGKGPVRLVFAHANGFNAQSYRRILEKLDVHSVAVDMRGHGQTDLPTDIDGLMSWDVFANDIAAFIGRYVPGKIILSGHSFGAVSAILASKQLTDRLAGYAGFDPVSMNWVGRNWPRLPGGRALMKRLVPIVKNAGQRRRVFENAHAAFERYQGRGAFKTISNGILRDYLDGGLQPLGNEVELSCDPKWEQAIFCAQAHNLYEAARFLPENSEAHYAGRHAVSTPSTRAQLGRAIGPDNIHFKSEFSHMFPLQEPDYVIEVLSKTIKHADWG